MTNSLSGKKLLVLGGASQHCKVVEAAKEMGIETHVADFLETAPAKEMADYSYVINVTETDRLARLCKEKGIDGILSGWLDFCQAPYQKLCEATGLPCYGTKEQFEALTNKARFKELCEKHGVGTPAPFPWRDWVDGEDRELPFPVFVKPSDSRGSRGSHVCRNTQELATAIEGAQKESADGRAVAERFIEDGQTFLVTYFFVNGRAYVQQLSNAYFGSPEWGMERINEAYRSPLQDPGRFFERAHDGFVAMLRSIGVENGPVCMQGFISGDEVLFFDPGRRFPGGEYERAYEKATGVDLVKVMIEFALTGTMPDIPNLDESSWELCGQEVLRLQMNARDGLVAEVEGFDRLSELSEVQHVALYHEVGDLIEPTGDVKQRFAQVVFLADGSEAMDHAVMQARSMLSVKDEGGSEMLVPIEFLKGVR